MPTPEIAERDITTVENPTRMLHYLHHFEGDVAVAYCGYRREHPTLSKDRAECVVCAFLWAEGFL